jgi:hypothetical protein
MTRPMALLASVVAALASAGAGVAGVVWSPSIAKFIGPAATNTEFMTLIAAALVAVSLGATLLRVGVASLRLVGPNRSDSLVDQTAQASWSIQAQEPLSTDKIRATCSIWSCAGLIMSLLARTAAVVSAATAALVVCELWAATEWQLITSASIGAILGVVDMVSTGTVLRIIDQTPQRPSASVSASQRVTTMLEQPLMVAEHLESSAEVADVTASLGQEAAAIDCLDLHHQLSDASRRFTRPVPAAVRGDGLRRPKPSTHPGIEHPSRPVITDSAAPQAPARAHGSARDAAFTQSDPVLAAPGLISRERGSEALGRGRLAPGPPPPSAHKPHSPTKRPRAPREAQTHCRSAIQPPDAPLASGPATPAPEPGAGQSPREAPASRAASVVSVGARLFGPGALPSPYSDAVTEHSPHQSEIGSATPSPASDGLRGMQHATATPGSAALPSRSGPRRPARRRSVRFATPLSVASPAAAAAEHSANEPEQLAMGFLSPSSAVTASTDGGLTPLAAHERTAGNSRMIMLQALASGRRDKTATQPNHPSLGGYVFSMSDTGL